MGRLPGMSICSPCALPNSRASTHFSFGLRIGRNHRQSSTIASIVSQIARSSRVPVVSSTRGGDEKRFSIRKSVPLLEHPRYCVVLMVTVAVDRRPDLTARVFSGVDIDIGGTSTDRAY